MSSNGTLICCHCFDAAAEAGSGAFVVAVRIVDRATPAVVDADLVTKERRSSSLLILLLLDEVNNAVLCERVPRLVGAKADTLLLTAARASMADE